MKFPQLETTGPFWAGLLVTPLLHLAFLFACTFVFTKNFDILLPILFLCAFQFLYMIPLLLFAYFTKRTALFQGFAMASGLTLLLQGSCWAVFPILEKL